MKKILVGLMLLISISSFATSQLGSTTVSVHFVSHGSAALRILSATVLKELSAIQIKSAITKAKVFDVENLCYQDPITSDTTCYDSQYIKKDSKILFDRQKWSNKSCREKLALSAHEYLNVLELEDKNYRYSHLLIGGDSGDDYLNNVIYRESRVWCLNQRQANH